MNAGNWVYLWTCDAVSLCVVSPRPPRPRPLPWLCPLPPTAFLQSWLTPSHHWGLNSNVISSKRPLLGPLTHVAPLVLPTEVMLPHFPVPWGLLSSLPKTGLSAWWVSQLVCWLPSITARDVYWTNEQPNIPKLMGGRGVLTCHELFFHLQWEIIINLNPT